MAYGNNLYSDISSFVGTIFQGALMYAYDNNVMAPLVLNFGDRQGMAVRNIAQYGTGATINAIGEDDDLVSQAFYPSSLANLTPAEVGAQYFITDQRRETDPFGVVADAQQELGAALASKVESDLLGHFNEFTAGTIGTTGSALTWQYFFAMQAILRHNKAPQPWNFVCTPYQFYRLGYAAAVGNTVTNAPALQDEYVRGLPWYMGRAYGVNMFVSSNCETSGNDAYAGMFSTQALALDWRRAPRLEPERDASRRGIELNLSAIYAHGVYRATYGVCGLFVSSAVTGV